MKTRLSQSHTHQNEYVLRVKNTKVGEEVEEMELSWVTLEMYIVSATTVKGFPVCVTLTAPIPTIPLPSPVSKRQGCAWRPHGSIHSGVIPSHCHEKQQSGCKM